MNFQGLDRVFREHPLSQGLSDLELALLASCSRSARIAPNAYLFREGQVADSLFLLRRGYVSLESHVPNQGAVKVETLSGGDVLGWSALFPVHKWHLDARALRTTIALVVDAHCLRRRLETQPALGYQVLLRLLFESHRRLERARLQQLDVYKAAL